MQNVIAYSSPLVSLVFPGPRLFPLSETIHGPMNYVQKVIQNDVRNRTCEPPGHPFGYACEHNFQFLQICLILNAPRVPRGPRTDPRWVPQMVNMCQNLVLETLSEKAPRHIAVKDTFTHEFTQNPQGPTSRKHSYLLHGSHIIISIVLGKLC